MGDAFFDAMTRGALDEDALEHERQALHAFAVEIPERPRFVAPIPDEITALVRGARVTDEDVFAMFDDESAW
jgi:hypothetical protein